MGPLAEPLVTSPPDAFPRVHRLDVPFRIPRGCGWGILPGTAQARTIKSSMGGA